jgi:hypothetical protein
MTVSLAFEHRPRRRPFNRSTIPADDGRTAVPAEYRAACSILGRMQLTATLKSDSGMHLIWDRAYFAAVRDYDTWSQELEEDERIRRHIAAAHVVPVYIHRDGAFTFAVRAEFASMPPLSEDEKSRIVVRSEPYRFACQGHFDISGIEYVHADGGNQVASIELPSGLYDVVVHVMDYDDVPQRAHEHPDFIITVGPARAAHPRQSIDTFERSG